MVKQHIKDSIAVKRKLLASKVTIDSIYALIDMCVMVCRSGGKILIAGNGGSAADAQHMASELVGRFLKERKGLSAIALSSDPSVVTAIGNDFGYDELFSKQVEAHGKPEDLLIVISTSGKSQNILNAVAMARSLGITTASLTGESGLFETCTDVEICVPSNITARIQECHTTVIHAVCDGIEQELFSC